ncbi:NADH-quinone oxidoreductase subunit I [Pyrococcus abyssi]|uniref:Formate hydrogen lyase subunit 6 (Hydrogenase 3 component F) n=1 Tax=Pyrococcus abyssi (strain GE5 / Orsay) TaxID=272844 RepID=Q9UYN5_PYRAB|nr:NADH-quinone oxidoreductase subunit I [Pyrococcus abyssi]CAB50377.1 Formate hydrogen lyase subunit 6 (hydrogenase 3 component F) [Pyrococcus abyssi GE5]CCE70924.1 TPA: hydrogenase-4 component b [Pyrococcus abyssi GE5]
MVEVLPYTEKLKLWRRPEESKKRIPVTTDYPFVEVEKPPEYRGVPHIDPELCIGCGACVNACPPDALIMEWDKENGVKRLTFNAARCIRCYRCVEVCPTGAMQGTLRFEVATPSKEDLVEVVEHRLAKCERCGNYLDFTERQIEYMLKILPDGIFDKEGIRRRAYLCKECRMRETVEEVKKGELR